MLCQNHGPSVFLWHWVHVQEADAEFSRVDSRDFLTVINEQHIEEDAAVWGFIMWAIWRPPNHWASPPEAKWLSDSLWDCNPSPSSARTNQSFLSQQIPILHPWLTVMSCPPPHPPSFFCGAKLIFRSLNVSIFYRWQQMNWLILHGWMGKTLSHPHLIPAALKVFKEFSPRKSYSLTKQTLDIWAFHFCEGHLPSLAQ